MKKFVSMVMAAAMIFALAAPAFAVKATTSSAVKATMTAPKVVMTAAKVSVTANPYRIKITDPAATAGSGDGKTQNQIVMAPAAFVNKSDTALNVYFLVTPGTSNNVKFTRDVANTKVKDGEGNAMPGAKLDVEFALQNPATTTAPTAWTGTGTQKIEVGGTVVCKDDFTVDSEAENNKSYCATLTSGKLTPIATPLATDLTVGNAIWVKVSGDLNTDVDWVNWKDGSNKAASIDFSIAVYCEPVANTVS